MSLAPSPASSPHRTVTRRTKGKNGAEVSLWSTVGTALPPVGWDQMLALTTQGNKYFLSRVFHDGQESVKS